MLAEIQEIEGSGGWLNLFHKISWQASQNASSQKIARLPENRQLNRYRDVLPYDHSRVILKGATTDYINANFVQVPQVDRKYILAQGPLPHTAHHFWQMVWEQESVAVIMLNRTVEKNQIKCSQYWPCGVAQNHVDSMVFENFRVTYVSERKNEFFTIRSLEVENLALGERRSISHFHYLTWPDFGVPSSPSTFLAFLFEVRSAGCLSMDVGPPVIHCSAGIGRSGTFAMVDSVLAEIDRVQDLDKVDVKGMLLEMRQYRVGLIQTGDQLRFTYIAILEGVHVLMPELYEKSISEYMERTGGAPLEESDEPAPPVPPPRKPVTPDGSTEAKRTKVVPDGFSSDEDGSDASDEILDLSASLSETESEDGTQHEPVAKNTDDNSEHNEDVITQSVAAPAAAEPGLEDAPMTEGLVMETQVNSETSGDGGDKSSDELQFEGREPGGASSQSVADEVPVGGSTVGLDETYQAPDTSDDLTKTQRQTESRQGDSQQPETADVVKENPLIQNSDKPFESSKETDEAALRKRRREDRKRKTSELVQSIKKKVKHEENSRVWKSSLKHFAVGVAVCSAIYLVYRYFS